MPVRRFYIALGTSAVPVYLALGDERRPGLSCTQDV